jgi:hypothetical protein
VIYSPALFTRILTAVAALGMATAKARADADTAVQRDFYGRTTQPITVDNWVFPAGIYKQILYKEGDNWIINWGSKTIALPKSQIDLIPSSRFKPCFIGITNQDVAVFDPMMSTGSKTPLHEAYPVVPGSPISSGYTIWAG